MPNLNFVKRQLKYDGNGRVVTIDLIAGTIRDAFLANSRRLEEVWARRYRVCHRTLTTLVRIKEHVSSKKYF